VTVAISGQAGAFGVLGAYTTNLRAFSQDDVYFLQAVASVLSAAVQRQQAAEALRKSEVQLRQAQKMEAVGLLAGGIAHDFNNLLTAIIGFANLIRDEMSRDHPMYSFVQEIATAGERASTLTRQLLTFSRQEIQQLERLDLNMIVDDMEKLLGRVIGEDIDLVSDLDPGLGQVEVDRGQIEQIIMNLAVNARDAMPEGGRLTITTANVERILPEDEASGIPGRYVTLAVTDTGIGMDAATQARIFEPFFTTKAQGKGTGLGLATVYGIVKQSRGDIQIASEPGRGATFTIYLPRVDEPSANDDPSPAPPGVVRGSETILLIEDEDGVRALASSVLERYGYRVLQARMGDEALDLCRGLQEPINLVITDVVMPGMNGAELARRRGELFPGVKVLFMSGYPGDVAVRHGVLSTGSAYLAKPFVPSELRRKVRELLDAEPGEPFDSSRAVQPDQNEPEPT
jgi:signal transduction histidine kinase/ActR/RegA family two-component response regulator